MSRKQPSQRQLRVAELLRHALADIFARGEINDPDLDRVVITVTGASISPDLRAATAFVVPLGGGEAGAIVAALNRAKRFIRGQVSRRIDLKYVPDIAYALDDSFDYSRSIDQLLDDPHVAQDLGSGSDQ